MIRIPKWYLYHDSGLFRIMDPESYQTLLSNTIIRTFFFDYVKVFCALYYLFIFFLFYHGCTVEPMDFAILLINNQ